MPGELGFDTGPFVTLACFCDSAVEAKDGALTLVRIVDQLTLSSEDPRAPDDLPPGGVVETTLVIGLKAGQARGAQKLQVTLEHPDGSRHPGPELPIHMSAGEAGGANNILKLGIQLSSAGLYWADVSLNKRLVTRVPLEVRYQKLPPGTRPLG